MSNFGQSQWHGDHGAIDVRKTVTFMYFLSSLHNNNNLAPSPSPYNPLTVKVALDGGTLFKGDKKKYNPTLLIQWD